MEDRARVGSGHRRRVFAALVLVASECVERDLRDDGGAGDDAGAPFEFAVDGDRWEKAAFQRFGSGHFCENHAVHNGGDYAGVDRSHAADRPRAWRDAREVLQESPAANYRLEAGGKNRWRRNGHPGSWAEFAELAAGLCDGIHDAGLHRSFVLRAIFLCRNLWRCSGGLGDGHFSIHAQAERMARGLKWKQVQRPSPHAAARDKFTRSLRGFLDGRSTRSISSSLFSFSIGLPRNSASPRKTSF